MTCAAAILLGGGVSSLRAQTPAPSLAQDVARLGDLDYTRRTAAARVIRRAPAREATAALLDAVSKSPDEYVRFRAFVLLAGFNDPRIADVARAMLGDRNDRLREAAYDWFERHPDPVMVPPLLAALETEGEEFVRPSLIRAVAVLDDDPRIRTALVREVGRGLDLFRGAVIEALGNRRASYAVGALAGVAALDGPLQDDAALALGKIGGDAAVKVLSGIKPVGADAQMTVRLATCLADGHCEALRDEIVREFSGAGSTIRPGSATVLMILAERGDIKALAAMVEAAGTAGEDARRRLVIALGSLALRQPASLIAWLGANAASRDAAVTLLREGFDLLQSDLAEESFYAAARASYWQAPDGSDLRAVTAALIDKLQF
uniref:HEAT repeat domain-containing protein n=1 Tax=uncultured bacterium 98 TaxID=698395 RepID=E3T6L9_9BACT|nr:hypothetical protein [uncultured bacterium 98]